MLCDFDLFQICFPCEFNSWCEWISNFFKFTRVREVQDINIFDSAWDVLDKTDFLIAVFHNRGLERYDIFFGNSNRDCERGMIQREALVWIDRVSIEFSRTAMQKHEIDDQIWPTI